MSNQGQITQNNLILNSFREANISSFENAKDLGDPNLAYDDLHETYQRMRACLGGERHVKSFDWSVRKDGGNLLIPFSPQMKKNQYDWYKSEAEWVGFTEAYARVLVGGLLRKDPVLTLPDTVDESLQSEIKEWLMNNFDKTDGTITTFLDAALWSEMNNSRAWLYLNYPVDTEEGRPYPILIHGDSVINWETRINSQTGLEELSFVIIEGFTLEVVDSERRYHRRKIRSLFVHELDSQGYYILRVYRERIHSEQQLNPRENNQTDHQRWALIRVENDFVINGERVDYIPMYPLNGHIEPVEPLLSSMVNTEIGLYNRIARRNHLLYGSASYTPVIFTHLEDEDKNKIRGSGLGSYWFLEPEDKVEIVTAPHDALEALENSIMNTITMMAKLGVRILSNDENPEQSGVALDIRNSYQAATLSQLAKRINHQFEKILTKMINWQYDLDLSERDLTFELSSDFNNKALAVEWFRVLLEMTDRQMVDESILTRILQENEILLETEELSKAQPLMQGQRRLQDVADNNIGRQNQTT